MQDCNIWQMQPDFDYTAITDEMGERIRQKMVEEKPLSPRATN